MVQPHGRAAVGWSHVQYHGDVSPHMLDAATGARVMRRYIAELVGTFVLVFGGCGSAVLAGTSIGYLGVAIAFGLSLLTMVYAIGPISGCHVNPAVTAGLLVAGRIDGRDAAGYVIAQVIGRM